MHLKCLILPALLAVSLCAAEKKSGQDEQAEPPKVAELPALKEFVRKDALVEADELAALLEKHGGQLVLIDARAQEAYLAGHLPGAFNVQSDLLQGTEPPYFMSSAATVKNLCIENGINPDSRVVIYDDNDGRLAARVWFTLHAYGHEGVAILNGGAALWREAKHPWTTELPAKPKPGAFTPLQVLRGVCNFSELPQFRVRVHTLGKPPTITLIDARALREYLGEDLRGKYGGHIPGAANIEWSALLTGPEHAKVWRPPAEIQAVLYAAGVDPGQKIAVYDQAGGRSAHLYFTLWLMGFDKIFNYAAGWREYGNREEVEIEK